MHCGKAGSAGFSARHRVAFAVVLAFVLAGCGSSSKPSADSVISSGQIDLKHADLQPPPGYTITTNVKGALRLVPAHGSVGAVSSAAGGSSTGVTVPLAAQDPTTALFTSLDVFEGCLGGLGVKFIGVPNAANPNSPANGPTYIKALSTCAAKSGIVQALKTEQSAQQNLTAAQIETQNKAYLKWRTCMIGRGWGIPQPTPDSRGLLFSFGGGGGGGGGAPGGGFTAPPGQSLLNSPDLQACAAQVQASTK